MAWCHGMAIEEFPKRLIIHPDHNGIPPGGSSWLQVVEL